MRTLVLLASLACSAAGEDLLDVKIAPEMPAADLVDWLAASTDTAYLYPPADLKGRSLGGRYDFRIPRDRMPAVADFLVRQCGLEFREYPPVKVILPRSALETRFRASGLDFDIEFDRGPGGWRGEQDAVGSLSTATVDALLAEAAKGRPLALDLLAAMGPRTPPMVAAVEKLLKDPALRARAAATLARFGFFARSALPGLREAANGDPSVGAAIEAIEAARHPGLLSPEDATDKAPPRFLVRFETTQGDFEVEVERDWSPLAADRFYNLVRIGFFDGCRFFRVVKGFVAQFGKSGDPEVNKRWWRATFQDEPVKESNKRGYLSFAKGEKDSRSTQVFVNLKDNRNLDGQGFPAFGRVVKGMEVVDRLYDGYEDKPNQNLLHFKGDEYLEENFPRLDRIRRATIVE